MEVPVDIMSSPSKMEGEELKEQQGRYRRHINVNIEFEKNKKRRRKVALQEKVNEEAVKRLVASEILLTETPGYLEAEGFEKTFKYTQGDILSEVDLGTASKSLNLSLSFGSYKIDFTRNGRHLLLGGAKGGLSVVDCLDLKVVTDINVRESIRDVCFLQSHCMWAAAQKKYVFIYDNQGIELHCLRDHLLPYAIDFLPFHYLLVSIGEFGELRYQDVSTGATITSYKTKRGPCNIMKHNPSNAVMHCGHQNGTLTMWTPNVGKPIVDILCHKGKITAAAALNAHYMTTAGVDGFWKVWDIRKFQPLQSYRYFGSAPTTMAWSQSELLGVGFGPHVQIWKDVTRGEKQKMPYMTHEMDGDIVEDLMFRPYEDFCYIGSQKGVESLVVPGCSSPNFDSFSADPYETKRRRREREVRSLLDKLPPSSITIDPSRLGQLDCAPNVVMNMEKQNALEEVVERRNEDLKKRKKKANKARGGSSTAARELMAKKRYAEYVRLRARDRLVKDMEESNGKRMEGVGEKEGDGETSDWRGSM